MQFEESMPYAVEREGNLTEESNRRYACDRCRGQKLRCERPTSSQADCRRCQRAGAICSTTGPSVPLSSRRSREDDEGNESRPSKRTNVDTQHQRSSARTGSATHPRSSPGNACPKGPIAEDINPLQYGIEHTPKVTSADQFATFLEGDQFSLAEPMLHQGFHHDMFNEFLEQEPPTVGHNYSIGGSASPTSMSLFGTNNDNSLPTPISQIGSRDGSKMMQMELRPWFDASGHVATGLRRNDMDALTQLNAAATSEAARADTIFRGDGTVTEEVRRASMECTLRSSDEFIGILKRLTEQVASKRGLARSCTMLGSKHEDQMVVLQLICLYGSLSKLFASILQYIESVLISGVDLDCCQHMCTVINIPTSTLTWTNNRHLWIRISVETCIHLNDMIYRRMERLSDSGAVDGMTLEMLNVALRKANGQLNQRHDEMNRPRQALRTTYHSILKLLQESMD